MEDEFDLEERQLLYQLKTLWINEKFSPELLFYDQVLVDSILEKIQLKENICAENNDNIEHQFMANIYEMEIERLKYMVKMYLRARLQKIEKYYSFILQNDQIISRLSDNEKEYCQKFSEMTEDHLKQSFLNGLPKSFKNNDKENVNQPNTSTFVFCQSTDDLGDVQVEDDQIVDFKKGGIYFLRYEPIKFLVEQSKIKLI
ncbi:hypothetical protein CYY_008124 [Polysphondylium violaceum]|uniref:DNA replication complex GINS protein SLD5 n=1 Tax=Polysphondylium violaceum TaxID=133409 RepID=A0A8J4UQE5_9MYCE|nr:hypothetical protein CYY_008124 [Polysphondylium violaceum]